MGSRPPVIGVIGGVASGKSFVARQLEQLGAVVIDADRLGHEVLRMPRVETAARLRWGDEIFSTEGKIDRRRLAARVFAPTTEGQEELRYLERLTHPLIREILALRVDQLLRQGDVPAVVIDAPLLVEAGWNEFCDRILFVEAPRAVRLARAAGRGWSEQEFADREARQHSCEVKRPLADVVIDNGGSDESTRVQTVAAWKMLGRPVPAG
jgi:dephospho-CoA kinase